MSEILYSPKDSIIIKDPININGKFYGIITQIYKSEIIIAIFNSDGKQRRLVHAKTAETYKYDNSWDEKYFKDFLNPIHNPPMGSTFISLYDRIQINPKSLFKKPKPLEERIQAKALELWNHLYEILGKKQQIKESIQKTAEYLKILSEVENERNI